MKAKSCLAALILVPSLAFAECLIDAETDRQLELLETAERAWMEYRDATCELIAQREEEDVGAEAMATCLNFYERHRQAELELISRLLTFTNVRSILEAE